MSGEIPAIVDSAASGYHRSIMASVRCDNLLLASENDVVSIGLVSRSTVYKCCDTTWLC